MLVSVWKFVQLDGKTILKMQCPLCALWQYLEDHSVDEAGQVLPSVVCGNEQGNCSFHEFVQLKGFPNNSEYKDKRAF